jgi:hypothetical protein
MVMPCAGLPKEKSYSTHVRYPLLATSRVLMDQIPTDIDVELPHEERQATLLAHWGFRCSCSLCNQDEPSLRASDDRLSKIQLLKQDIISAPSLPAIEELLRLYDEERLVAPQYNFWELAAYANNEMGRKEESVRFASLVHEFAMWLAGPESPQAIFWGNFVHSPEQHPSWRARMR